MGTSGNGENTTIDFDALNRARLPDYHRLDASIAYDFKLSKKENSPKAKLGFSILNLYGRENNLNRSYNLVQIFDAQGGSTIELEENTRFSLGVTPNLMFRLNF